MTNKNIDDRVGITTIEAMYREVKRNGKPYFNELTVTYTLKNKLEKVCHKIPC